MTAFIPGEFLFVPMYPLRKKFETPVVWKVYDVVVRELGFAHLLHTRFSHYDNTSGTTWIAFKILSVSTEPTA